MGHGGGTSKAFLPRNNFIFLTFNLSINQGYARCLKSRRSPAFSKPRISQQSYLLA
jgi:hypothetical protein